MNIGFYAGSFSPFTNGHLHVVREASKLFDKFTKKIVGGDEVVENDKKEEPTTKLCPYCLSEINIKAIRCPHCTSKLEEEK